MDAIILSAKKLAWIGAALVIAFAAFFVGQHYWGSTVPTSSFTPSEAGRVIHMVTGEFASKTEDGKELEAYRWDPGTIMVDKGEAFTLSISGVNGKEHPFHIEGTDVKGVVKQGEETLVDLKFDKKGVYRLICETHMDMASHGPMIAYIVVR